MNKSTFFTGQPIFSQLLQLIPRSAVQQIARDHKADRYCKRFSSYEHLVTMLYAVFNNCQSLREISTGMLAVENRLIHLGVRYYPRRSTLADANIRRSYEVFEQIYYAIFKRYQEILSDSRSKSKARTKLAKLYIIDSTTIRLFHEVLRGGGPIPANGRKKGGVKVHTLIRSDQDVPCMIRLSSGVANDSKYLKEIQLPKGSVLAFDRGYHDFATFNRFTEQGITWITRKSDNFALAIKANLRNKQSDKNITYDREVIIGHKSIKNRVKARLIGYRDPDTKQVYEYLTNNLRMNALSIVLLYKKRWQIETLFKRVKQNYPLKYFMGDSENAIRIQIWCSLIADLLLKIIKKTAAVNWSFSNLAAMIRLHLLTYIHLTNFLRSPEKTLLSLYGNNKSQNAAPNLFAT
jgi:hypothetical protein